MDNQPKTNKIKYKWIDLLDILLHPTFEQAAKLGFTVMLVFSISLIIGFFTLGIKINNANMNTEDLKETAQLINACKKIQPQQCSFDEASLTMINEQLESINNALKLEEMSALIGIFVTISTILIPLFVIYNLKDEKQELKDEIKKTSETAGRVNKLEDDLKKKMEAIDKTANDMRDTMIGIFGDIASVKIAYTQSMPKDSYIEALRTAHDIENSLILLLSHEYKEVKNGFNQLHSLIDFQNKTFSKKIQKVIQKIQLKGYLQTSDMKKICKIFMDRIKPETLVNGKKISP